MAEAAFASDYQAFIAAKLPLALTHGRSVSDTEINPLLFPFQRDLVRWSVRKGRSALFADTGLGKTLMQVEWARLMNVRTIIVAPLSVAQQTVEEARKLDVQVRYLRADDGGPGIVATNYEMVEHFDPDRFGAVVLDESSILKAFEGKVRSKLISMFERTPYRLCCTATPAPNDIQEMANHSEFLGMMSRVRMLSQFFVHDDNGWRLKKHAVIPFFRWLASWAITLKKPSDLGYDDDGFILPPLSTKLNLVQSDYVPDGQLFHAGLHGIQDRAAARRATSGQRVIAASRWINGSRDQCIAWVGLNDEGRRLAESVPDSVLMEGADSPETKHEAIDAFRSGRARVLITKPRIAGFGLNLQNCHRMAFVGMNDSFEQFYQCVRRCWRFGQGQRVDVAIFLSSVEVPIYHNVMRKHREATIMSDALVANVAEFEKAELDGRASASSPVAGEATGSGWRLMLGDSCERMAEVPDGSVHLSVFSPPFASLYTYSPSGRDLGNSESSDQFFEHFGYIIKELRRVMVPGRNVCVHVANITSTKATDGVIGIKDFRGDMIRSFVSGGFVYHGEVCIDKNPQAQAIRTHSKGLLFVQKNKDSTASRPALADYILIFKAPGDNPIPVVPDVTNDEWVIFAHPVWYDIRETDTLNIAEGRANNDERHICALQLPVIERCIRLWTNAGETVLSPFAGIGSEGHVALRHSRRFVGIELKPEYFETATKNLKRAETQLELEI